MAKDDKTAEAAPVAAAPEFSDADKSKARQWFKRAATLREQRNYDYAIESILTGLEVWPEAVDEGHLPLWSLAIQRQQAGGKKPGMMDGMKRPMSGKDPKQALINAEWLLARDPTNTNYLDGLLKNAVKADFPATTRWIAAKVLESLGREKKPDIKRFKEFRASMVEMAERCAARGDPETTSFCYDHAVQAVEHLLSLSPNDMALKDEQRDLSGRLTITKGKYSTSGTFRDSIRDADAQKRLQDQDRGKQGEDTLEDLIRGTRKDYEANPGVPVKFNNYIEALLKTERRKEEDEAIDVLMKTYAETKNYSYKVRADDVRLRQVARQSRQLKLKASQSGTDEDRQQARLAKMEENALEVEVYKERVYNYPTDMRLKYKLGEASYRSGDFDEAIPMLQQAQADPRYRARSQLLMGRAFFEKELYSQAAHILQDALDTFQPTGDDSQKHLLWWLGKAYKAAGKIEEARTALNKLVLQDYNFADGEARKLLEELKSA